MTAVDFSKVHICRPATVWLRSVQDCPTCDHNRRFVGMCQEWYSAVWTCCACGDSWEDGERLVRPFCRGWRTEAVARARRQWAAAPSRAAARRLFRSWASA